MAHVKEEMAKYSVYLADRTIGEPVNIFRKGTSCFFSTVTAFASLGTVADHLEAFCGSGKAAHDHRMKDSRKGRTGA
jgi:hypothetical protein